MQDGVMHARDAEELLRTAKVDPTTYYIGGSRDSRFCLVHEGPQWAVFTGERGGRFEEARYESEDDACVDFLRRVLKYNARDK